MIIKTAAAWSLAALALAALPAAAIAAPAPLSFEIALPDAPGETVIGKHAARFAVIPFEDLAADEAVAQASTGATVPMWSTTITDGKSRFEFAMIGNNPEVADTTPATTIPSFVIPVEFDFTKYKAVFDPTIADPDCAANVNNLAPLALAAQGPIFNPVSLTEGGTALEGTGYVDLFQRANFFKYTQPGGINPNYHVTLGNTALAANKVTVTIAGGTKPYKASCGSLGVMPIATFDAFLRTKVFPALPAAVTQGTLPIFLLYNVVLTDGGCCILGYHTGFTRHGVLQTYVVADFDSTKVFSNTSDISSMSHEVAEWLDDPLGTNPTKPWGHTGQVSVCQDNLEVGDPLSGVTLVSVTMPSDSFTYHMQDLAFLSWFYHQSPSIGVNGWYSLLGTFKTPAAACK